MVEDLLCDTQERNDIHNEDQNNINKDDEFIAKIFEEISKLKEDVLNELSTVRPPRKLQNNKKNKRVTNLGNYAFESIVRKMRQ